MNNIISRSFLNALAAACYIAGIATLMQNGERVFGEMHKTTGPIAFLMLFVVSAGITGGLIVGKPLLLYFDNQKNAAVKMFIYTLGWLALGVVILLLASIQK